MAECIAFIEYPDQIDFLESFLNHNTVVVSLSPSVSNELKKRNITFYTTVFFFGEEGHKFVSKKSSKIITNLRPFLAHLKNENIQHAFEKTWIFYFRFHLHYYLSMLFVINQVVNKNNPELLITSTTKNENLLSDIIQGYGLANNIKTSIVNTNNKQKIKNPWRGLIKKIAKRIIFEFQLIFVKYFFKNKSSILAPEDTYNMPDFLDKASQNLNYPLPVYLRVQKKLLKNRISEMLRGKSFSFLSLPSEALFEAKNNFTNKLLISNNEIRNHLYKNSKLTSFFGLNIDIFLLNYVENSLNSKMVELNNEIIALRRVLNSLKPDKVFAQHSLGISYALGEVCLALNIPAMLITHGSHTPHNDGFAKLEWSIHSHTIINSHYPLAAIQTPLAELFLKMSDNLISRMIKTGPLLIAKRNNHSNKGQTRKKIFNENSDKFIVLHAGTPKSWNSLRPWVFETIDEYIKNINDVITAVDEISGMFLAIRFRPQSGFTLKDLKSQLKESDCYEVYDYGNIADYLIASDLLISYSSTTIEEALQSQLQVLQYDPSGKYEHIPSQLLSKNSEKNISEIYYVNSEDDLMSALEWCSKKYNFSKNLLWTKYIIESDEKLQWLSMMETDEC